MELDRTPIQTTVSAEGAVVLPTQLRDEDDFQPGEVVTIQRMGGNSYVLQRTRPGKRPNEGLVDWLLACPEKDWFQQVRSGETTEDVARRARALFE